MVSLHYLKYTHNLSDEAVVRGWVENPYWQYLSVPLGDGVLLS
jgi:IS5 family transposase